MKKVIDKLKSYIHLSIDYDGYGGHPPSKITINNLIEVINKLPSNIKTPSPMCGRDSAAIYWELNNNKYIEICVYEDGEVTSFINDSEEEDKVGTVENPNISSKLIELISLND